MKESFIQLEAFRKRNKLSQDEVAEYLGTTKSYICMVEKGTSKLSDKKIEMLFECKGYDKPWDTQDLSPDYSRIMTLSDYVKKEYSADLISYSEEKYKGYISFNYLREIQLGHERLDQTTVNDILTRFRQINYEWLLNGNGTMIKDVTAEEMLVPQLSAIFERLDILEGKLDEMNATLDYIAQHIK